MGKHDDRRIKDPADFCDSIRHFDPPDQQRILRAWLYGELTPAQETLREYDRALLAERYAHPQRILTALRLAPDLETLNDLLAGQPVDPARLDKTELARAKNRKLVRLDMTAIDQLEGLAA